MLRKCWEFHSKDRGRLKCSRAAVVLLHRALAAAGKEYSRNLHHAAHQLHRHASGRLGKESALEQYLFADGIFIVIAKYCLFFLILLFIILYLFIICCVLLLRQFYFLIITCGNCSWTLKIMSCIELFPNKCTTLLGKKNQFLVF